MAEHSDGVIVTNVGRCFEIPLMTHGGTGYIWCLTGLPKGVALTEVTDHAVKVGFGGTVRQTFSFLATAIGGGELTFALLRPWDPSQPADHRTFSVTVDGAEAESTLEAKAGSARFVHESFTPLVAASDAESDATTMDSRHNCTMKYAAPQKHGGPVLKYGFPVAPMYAVRPSHSSDSPIVCFYMAQPPRG